jgi:hypothetical protein
MDFQDKLLTTLTILVGPYQCILMFHLLLFRISSAPDEPYDTVRAIPMYLDVSHYFVQDKLRSR